MPDENVVSYSYGKVGDKTVLAKIEDANSTVAQEYAYHDNGKLKSFIKSVNNNDNLAVNQAGFDEQGNRIVTYNTSFKPDNAYGEVATKDSKFLVNASKKVNPENGHPYGAIQIDNNNVIAEIQTDVKDGNLIFELANGNKINAGSVNSGGTELGHTVICAGGRQCTCGRRGCFEAYASATALTKATKEKMEELKIKGIPSRLFEVAEKEGKVSARTAFDAMRLGDAYGKMLVDEYMFYLAEGVTNMINIFQPVVLTIGGGVCNEKDYLMVPLLRHVDREQYTRDNKNKTKVLIAALKNDAGIIGAAGLGAN